MTSIRTYSISVALLLIALWVNNSLASQRFYESNDAAKQTDNAPLPGSYRRQAWAATTTTTTGTPTTGPSEYREMMSGLYKLTNLDEDLRNRLQRIEHKLSQFESTNLAKAESLETQLLELKSQMANIESLQQTLNQNIEALKLNDIELVGRSQRQQNANSLNSADVTDSQKLEAVATLLVSNTAGLKQLEAQLSSNITRLLTQTSSLFNRVERIRRNQLKSNRVNAVNYANQPVDSDPEQTITSCNQGFPTTNGILKLSLPHQSAFYVLCDEVYDHGGWTIIQNRHYGDVNFQRDWKEYKTGFGNLAGDFFLGLDKIHALTTHTLHELVIVLEDHANLTQTARYNLFAIGNEEEAYTLKLLGSYSGTAGDSFSYHAGSKFSTFDNDNDGCVECNCAAAHLGGWWYNWCDQSNLNGKYHAENYNSVPTYQGVYWHNFHGPNYSLRSVRMMIRPLVTDEVRR